MSELFFSVDSLVIRNNVLFGFGWVFHTRYKIKQLRFKLNFFEEVDAPSIYIAAELGKPRSDVKSIFDNQLNALNSGYVISGAFSTGVTINSISLICLLEDDQILELAVPNSSFIQYTSAKELVVKKFSFRKIYFLFKRVAILIVTAKFTILFEKIRSKIKKRPKSHLYSPTDLVAQLSERDRKNICLIIDHDLGGGANLYREILVDSMVKNGRSVLILSYQLSLLSYILIIRNSKDNDIFSIYDKNFILEAVEDLSITDIIYNNAVSFSSPEELPTFLVTLKNITSARLKVLVHDFYLVCPSHFLLDHESKHCYVPEMSVCSGCLPKNEQVFTSLFFSRDIFKWRSLWGSLLANADEIITFSNNSSQLILKAYPKIHKDKISIVPHIVNYLPSLLPKITNTKNLCIGVVGHIGFHKGSLIIKAISQEISRRGIDLKIAVIGIIDSTCNPSVVTQTGSYKHQDLPSLIERSGANVMFFPSIWPETFSYVVQELMNLNLPIASFNLGAPAERLAFYSKGLVLDSMDPVRVLDELISFHRKTYLSN
jgi:glycosyltransferase involved in cell wall biosynthesis